MHYLIFTLSVPHRGSWNNKWSGDGQKYAIARRFNQKDFDKLPDIVGKYHEYHWDDGWTAAIDVQHVTTAKEKNELVKGSVGFCNYDWMIDSLLRYGKIQDK